MTFLRRILARMTGRAVRRPPDGGPAPIIRVVDFETTGGLPPDHAVIEAGWIDLVPWGYDLLGRPTWMLRPGGPTARLVNPWRPIMPEAQAVNQLTAGDLVGAQDWATVLPRLLTVAPGEQIVAWAAFGVETEQAWLTRDVIGPARWICARKLALRLWPEAPRHSNQVLRFWRDPGGFDRRYANPAHRAGPDAFVTANLLVSLLGDLTIEQAEAWTVAPALLARVPFGNHKGGRWIDVDDDFLHWVLARDFDTDVIYTARTELERRYPPQLQDDGADHQDREVHDGDDGEDF